MTEPLVEPLGGDDDLAGVMEIDRKSFATPWTLAMYQAELQNQAVSSIVVLRLPERQVAGYCSYWFVVDEIHINNVAVDPEFRRRGLGRYLVEYVLREGVRRGAGRAILEVRAGNLAARQLYQQLGFLELGVRRGYYSDTSEDALILAKTIQILERNPNT